MTEFQHDGETYELPRYDMQMARRVSAIDDATSDEQRWRAEWELARSVVGADAMRDLVGGERVESCDLIELGALCQEVREAYERPQNDAVRKRVADALSVLDGADLDRLVRASETMAKLTSRQGFRKVK